MVGFSKRPAVNTGPADLLCNMDMVAMRLDIYVDSGIKYTIDNHESNLPRVKNL